MHTTAQLQGAPFAWMSLQELGSLEVSGTLNSWLSVQCSCHHTTPAQREPWPVGQLSTNSAALHSQLKCYCCVSLWSTGICTAGFGGDQVQGKGDQKFMANFFQILRLRFHWRPLDNRIAHKGHKGLLWVSLSFPPVVRHQDLERSKK